MSHLPKVAIFWDYENCCPPSSTLGLGFDIVNNISRLARLFGPITSFRAYLDVSVQTSKSVTLRSELQSSGLSIIDCPHNGKKDVVDKMILVDMLAFAVDHPSPATIFLITGDRDYAYAVSTLKLRNYKIILVVPSSPHASPSLESQASVVIDWGTAVLRSRTEQPNSIQPLKQPYPDLDTTLVNKLMRELRESPSHDLDTPPHGPSSLQRVTARDLFESLKYSNNNSPESARDFTHPMKHTSTVCDDACDGGLRMSRTPLRSPHASVSTGSTRPCSTTIVSQSPPAVEQYTTTEPENVQPRRSITFDQLDAEKHTLIPTSPNALDLPLHNGHPPSSAIVRPPFEPAQSTYEVPGRRPTIPSSHKLNCLASTFAISKAPTGSIPDEEAHRAVNPIYPTTLVETRTSACGTPQMNLKDIDIGDLKDVECLMDLPVEDEGNIKFEQALPHRLPPDSTTPTHVTSHTTHSLSARNVEPDVFTAPAGFLGTGGGGDLMHMTPNARDCSASCITSPPSSSASPSAPSTTAESHDERKPLLTMFKPLIRLLIAARERDIVRPPRSVIAAELITSDKQVYRRAGASKFKEYTALAEQAGVIELGGKLGDAWIALHPKFQVDEITTTSTRSRSNGRVFSAFGSPKTTPDQYPLFAGSERIETRTSFHPPGPSLMSSGTSPALPAIQQDNAFVPTQFQPLIDTLVQLRDEGFYHPRRTSVRQALKPIVYSKVGVSGFNEYIYRASQAQLVQLGGDGGYVWIRLHPDLQI